MENLESRQWKTAPHILMWDTLCAETRTKIWNLLVPHATSSSHHQLSFHVLPPIHYPPAQGAALVLRLIPLNFKPYQKLFSLHSTVCTVLSCVMLWCCSRLYSLHSTVRTVCTDLSFVMLWCRSRLYSLHSTYSLHCTVCKVMFSVMLWCRSRRWSHLCLPRKCCKTSTQVLCSDGVTHTEHV